MRTSTQKPGDLAKNLPVIIQVTQLIGTIVKIALSIAELVNNHAF